MPPAMSMRCTRRCALSLLFQGGGLGDDARLLHVGGNARRGAGRAEEEGKSQSGTARASNSCVTMLP